MFQLDGKVALITGASSGIGAHLARTLARAGAKVVLSARRIEKLEEVAEAIRADGGIAIATVMDTTNEESVASAYDTAEAIFGTVDIIVANAGVSWAGRTTDMPAAAFDNVIAVDLRGPFLTAREGARRLIASSGGELRGGHIILLGSITASAPEPGLAAYSAAKAGLVQMAKVMALEWIRFGINVNVISPGYVRTEMNDDWFASTGGQARIANFPRRRLMDREALDGALLFLASEASANVTGVDLVVDDGQSL